jgi:hypothetical protein
VNIARLVGEESIMVFSIFRSRICPENSTRSRAPLHALSPILSEQIPVAAPEASEFQ